MVYLIYRDDEVVDIFDDYGEAQAAFDGLCLDDEDQEYTWALICAQV